jgi:hypothetical protein
MESRSHTQAQPDDLGVGGVLHVLSGCVRAHPPDVAPELASEWGTRSRALFVIVAVVAWGCFVGAVIAVVVNVGAVMGASILADVTDVTVPS